MLFCAMVLSYKLAHTTCLNMPEAGVQEMQCVNSDKIVRDNCRAVALWAGYIAWNNMFQESVNCG